VSDEEATGENRYGQRVGERLRAAREAEGLDLSEVAARTRVPMRHLLVIEQGDYTGLPAATYSAGFIKAYARLLGLDGQSMSEEFRREMASSTVAPQHPAPYEPADPRRTPPAGLALGMLLIAIVAGLIYLYWRGSAERPIELAVAAGEQAAPATPQTTAPPPAPANPVQPAGGAVSIGASQEVWIKVSDSGKTLFMGILNPGDHYQVPADAVAPLLTTGRPGVTMITVGATAIPPVGDPDRAAKDVSLKTDALLTRVTAAAPAAQPAASAPTPVENAARP
jgi:cytoskeletal protein RodZ